MTERLLTPSKITAWLDCAHYLALKHQVEDGAIAAPGSAFGSFAQLLADKGLQHETECLDTYLARGLSVLRVPDRERGESFSTWVSRVGNPLNQGYDVVYQMPFVHQGVRGIADFLIRVELPDGSISYEPVDAKLARVDAKPGHVLQLCFYADAIEQMTGHRPRRMHLWLGSGRLEALDVDAFAPYWRRIRTQLALVLALEGEPGLTVPEPCGHCGFCEFSDVCTGQWRSADSLIYVAGLRSTDRGLMEAVGIATVAGLAEGPTSVDGIDPGRLDRLVQQAVLQVEARLAGDDVPPPFRMIEAGDDPTWGRGLEQLPEPDAGDVFLDFEGHPFWTPSEGLFFLFGLIEQDDRGEWTYNTWWAHDIEQEMAAVEALIDYLDDRRSAFPGMHIYHYNHTERSSLERLVSTHGVGEVTLRSMVATGRFVDLFAVARNAMQVGTESYGLKSLERLTDYERGHDIDAGAGAVVSYETYMATGDEVELSLIAAYNEDDVRATMALRDWLVAHRPDDLPWRAAEVLLEVDAPELDEQVAALHAFGVGTPEHLLGDVLGYWRREWLAHLAPRLVRSQGDHAELLDHPDALAGLVPVGLVERLGVKGNVLKIPAMRFSIPPQEAGDFRGDDSVLYAGPDGSPQYSSICALDVDAGVLELMWSATEDDEPRPVPSAVIRNDWVAPRPKPAALSQFAGRVLDTAGPLPNPASLALLRRDKPSFVRGGGPPGGLFSDDLEEMTAWAAQLDGSFVAIQGPPGTGKTFRAAHLVLALLRAGMRVGITAFSHSAIDNVLAEVVAVLDAEGERDLLNAVRRGSVPSTGPLPNVTYASGNPACANLGFNVVAGTTWLFSGDDLAGSPVDVLLVDEAGQLALADALAAARSARNLVLLGDPLQLPQVSQAAHPGGSGLSVLEHVLGDDVTISPDRGVFIHQTRRMHPDVCSFISNEIYQGRLTSHESCAAQGTQFGTGLRWMRAEHAGRTTMAPEEVDLVRAEVARLMGTPWTNADGVVRPLTPHDFMVVAPYNNQVNLLREYLDADPLTRGVPVGTVDKFQGRQAAVVFFTMTASSSAEISRGTDFLFSRNRLNVALSRARCLAYLVCTEELLNTRARDVDDMRLISTLCAFVESAQFSDAPPTPASLSPSCTRAFCR